jgi:hypothetical protein
MNICAYHAISIVCNPNVVLYKDKKDKDWHSLINNFNTIDTIELFYKCLKAISSTLFAVVHHSHTVREGMDSYCLSPLGN